MSTKVRIRRNDCSFEIRTYEWSQLSEMTRGVSRTDKDRFFNFEEITLTQDSVFAKAGERLKYIDGE